MTTPFERVLQQPGSLAARQALAAAGGPRAELVRLQLEYRRRARAGESKRKVEEEVDALVAARGRELAGAIADLVTRFEFHRGLVASIDLSGDAWVRHGDQLVTLAPIQHVTITAPLGDVAAILATAATRQLSSLFIGGFGMAFGDAGAIALARSPNVIGLKVIDVYANAIGDAGVEAMAASPYLEGAAYINFAANPANPTPFANIHDDFYGRPELARRLQAAFGERPWLAVPTDALPPDWDELAITP